MRYYLVAGEKSGDIQGGRLMQAIKEEDPHAIFRYWGGQHMQQVGGTLVVSYTQLAWMGLNFLGSLRKIRQYLQYCQKDLLLFRPDVVILIDYAGFNLRIAKFAKKQGIKTFYYISPKLWAWNRNRIYDIKACVDKMFTIFPFEANFYKQYAYPVDYVGNPFWEQISLYTPVSNFRTIQGLDERPIIALMPGSRLQEIKKILPIMLSIVPWLPAYQFVVVGISELPTELYAQASKMPGVRVIYDAMYDVLTHAYAAVVTSGTATLETAYFQVPQVVVYKTHYWNYLLGRWLVKLPYISLVNILAGQEIVKELIQYQLTPQSLLGALQTILTQPSTRHGQLVGYAYIKKLLGQGKASKNAAKLMVQYLRTPDI